MLCRSTSKIIPIRIHWAKQLPYNETLSLKAKKLVGWHIYLKKKQKTERNLYQFLSVFLYRGDRLLMGVVLTLRG